MNLQKTQTLPQQPGGTEKHRKPTRRDMFLGEMEQIVPWKALYAAIEPFYPKAKPGGGRPTIGLEKMLRMYFLQQWYSLSDCGVEEALYDSSSMRNFVGIDLDKEAAPDETTLCRFRHLLEDNNLAKVIFDTIQKHLQNNGFKVANGTIVDATIIHAPTSTKNKDKERDQEMHSTKKGNQWFYGMKAHIGVDSKTRLIHSLATTAANVHDSQVLPELLHGSETRVWGDSAYNGQKEPMQKAAPRSLDFTNEKGRRNAPLTDEQKRKNKTKSGVRAKVEHPFRVLKGIFHFAKVCYRGIAKNTHKLYVALGLVNLYLVRKKLLRIPEFAFA